LHEAVNRPDSALLEERVRRMLTAVRPERVVLFGSGARGEWGEHSDLDVLVVVPEGTPRRETAQRIYRNLVGVGRAVDLVVVSASDVRRFAHSPATVIEPALRDGQVLYAA